MNIVFSFQQCLQNAVSLKKYTFTNMISIRPMIFSKQTWPKCGLIMALLACIMSANFGPSVAMMALHACRQTTFGPIVDGRCVAQIMSANCGPNVAMMALHDGTQYLGRLCMRCVAQISVAIMGHTLCSTKNTTIFSREDYNSPLPSEKDVKILIINNIN